MNGDVCSGWPYTCRWSYWTWKRPCPSWWRSGTESFSWFGAGAGTDSHVLRPAFYVTFLPEKLAFWTSSFQTPINHDQGIARCLGFLLRVQACGGLASPLDTTWKDWPGEFTLIFCIQPFNNYLSSWIKVTIVLTVSNFNCFHARDILCGFQAQDTICVIFEELCLSLKPPLILQ